MKSIYIAVLAAACLAGDLRPVRAEETASIITRAQQTLDDIARLIDSIEARKRTGGATVKLDSWESLFDGKSLAGWKKTDFTGGGEVRVEGAFRGGSPAIAVAAGTSLSGFNWTGDVPHTDYEVALEFMKLDGSDFACGLTFPVGNSHASLILGGWGGGVVGISSIDGLDASENATTKYLPFEKERWYRVRLRVTPAKLEAWLDDKQVVDQEITGKKIGLRVGAIALSRPLGISTYQTSAAFRGIKLRRLESNR